tara:strand:- start:47 stop:1012 length:966 start_codon:yes stop_codon:yes gene_type:complete
MKILITGGGGFIGFHLANILLLKGYKVDLTDILEQTYFDNDLKTLTLNSSCNYLKCNLLDKKEINKLDPNYDLIIHLAAIVGVENVISNSYRVLESNQLMLNNIINFANSHSVKPKFIFASTSEVYAGSQFLNMVTYPTTEENLLTIPDLSEPRTSYMLSKIYGEAMCHASGLNFIILRPHNIYGPRMGMKHVIPQLFMRIKNTKANGIINIYSPDHTRTFCYVNYAVEKISQLIDKDKWLDKIINLGVNSPEIKIRDLAKLILKIMQRDDISINDADNTQGSPSRRVPDTTKLNNNTKKIKITSLQNGITETYNWYKKHL